MHMFVLSYIYKNSISYTITYIKTKTRKSTQSSTLTKSMQRIRNLSFHHYRAYKTLAETHKHTTPHRNHLWSECSNPSWLDLHLWHKPWYTCTSRSELRKGNNKLLSAVVARANCLRMHTMPALHSLHTIYTLRPSWRWRCWS